MKYFDLKIVIDEDDPDCAEILVRATADGTVYELLLDSGSSKTM